MTEKVAGGGRRIIGCSKCGASFTSYVEKCTKCGSTEFDELTPQ